MKNFFINRNEATPIQVRFDNDGREITHRRTTDSQIAAGVPIVFETGVQFKENRRYKVSVSGYDPAGYIQWIYIDFAD